MPLHPADTYAEQVANEEPQANWGKPPESELVVLLTVGEAAKTLGISAPTVSQALNIGRIPYIRKHGLRLIPLSAVEAYKHSRRPQRTKK